ncbi:MAG: DUF805 domain-containing protein [Paracoccaceae bacterium]
MDFQTAVRTCLLKYATFTGRARRAELWWFVLFNLLVQIVMSLLDGILGIALLSVLFSLAMIVPNIAVGVRRLHDLDKSGWWYLLVLIPVIGALILIFFFIQRGTVGPNRFGADPLAEEDTVPA